LTTVAVAPPERLERRLSAVATRKTPERRTFSARTFAGFGALAAAAILSLGITTHQLSEENARNDAVLATIANSHFKHVSMTPTIPGAPVAKVLYAPASRWVYVIVDAAKCDCRVVGDENGASLDLGSPASDGHVSTLFLKDTKVPQTVRLVGTSGVVVAEAPLQ
jgi:hypothetical protein